jgi:valyl-tRNA synthetase
VKPVFVIDTPPPFTSGSLHIGRAYACVLSDVTARYKRMRGYNVLLPQGWDTQGLPTELVVQSKLGISPHDVGRFRKACKKWTEQMIRQMRNTMVRLGYIPDWTFEYRTMDPEYHRKVQLALLNLYRMNRIYRARHPVHWCPKCGTALADAELGYIKEETSLIYMKFKSTDRFLEIATTRPELLHACVAVAFHPEDKRYQGFRYKELKIPIYNRRVPLIADGSVDPAYGTGLVMVCTFGDEQDVKTVLRHKLPSIDALDDEGRIINSGKYDGLTIKEARKAILDDLTNCDAVSKIEKLSHNVLAHTERSTCQTPIEFLPKQQWFIRIVDLKERIARSAEKMEWFPAHMKKRLVDWANGLEWDWLFSRQRAFGTPIPFWYCQECDAVIAPKGLPIDPAREKPPVEKCPQCGSNTLTGAKEICDCWVDSSITPLVIAGWPHRLRHYPISLRQQGSEIIRTWAFYSIVQCYLQTDQLPFDQVLVNGMVLGSDGNAMSSSLGNVVDPLEVVKKYGADSLRQALLLASIGSDFPFEWKDVKYCYSFMQKLWNACRFAQKNLKVYGTPRKPHSTYIVDEGVLSIFQRLIANLTEHMETFQYSLALQELQNFVWHELCDYYLEIIKSRLCSARKEWIKESALYTLHTILLKVLNMHMPFAPHIAEELSGRLFNTTGLKEGWPSANAKLIDEEAERSWVLLKETISTARKFKTDRRLRLNAEISKFTIHCEDENSRRILETLKHDIKEAGKIKQIKIVARASGYSDNDLMT